MPLITLLKKGSLEANVPDDKETQAKLNNYVPIDYIMEWFKKRIDSGETGLSTRILILKSDTGSGKSTAFPPNIFKNFYTRLPKEIAVTQPRIMNAITIVRDQIVGGGFYPYLQLGVNIGWQTGPSRYKSKYGLTYMTIGVLMEQMKSMSDRQIMNKYGFIVIDEVHEASQEQAVLLYMMRNFYERNKNNPDLPFLILTSATFDTDKFLKYFGVYNAPEQPNLIKVRGFAYPLEERWIFEHSTINYINTAIDTIAKIHRENPDDTQDNMDILLFLPSGAEMAAVISKLNKINENLAQKGEDVFLILQIDSDAVKKNKSDFVNITADINELTVRIKGKTITPKRRVILSTSVAETGVTIDTLKYIIDSGYNRGPEYNPNFNITGILTKPAQKSRIRQRMGRANRKSPGIFYPLYPKYVYEKLPTQQLAEVEISDISQIILGILLEQTKKNKQDGIFTMDIDNIKMIDTPPFETLYALVEKLYALGYISPVSDYIYIQPKEDNLLDLLELIRDNSAETPTFNLTKIGAIASYFTFITPERTRLILGGYSWCVSILDLITISAYLELANVDIRADPGKDLKWQEIYKMGAPSIIGADEKSIFRAKLLLADDFINGLIIFNAVKNVIANNKSNFLIAMEKWCAEVMLSYTGMIEFMKIRDSIIDQMLTIGLDPFANNDKSMFNTVEEKFMDIVIAVKYCIYDAYRLNMAIFDDDIQKYRTLMGLAIITPPLFSENERKIAETKKYGLKLDKPPKYIIYDSVKFKLNRKTQMYDCKVSRVSTMDGYVHVDPEFIGVH